MMQTSRDRYERQIEVQLKLWGARLGILRARAEKASASIGVELQPRIDELHRLQELARKHLDEYGSTSAGRWTVTRTSHQATWAKLSDEMEASWRRVK